MNMFKIQRQLSLGQAGTGNPLALQNSNIAKDVPRPERILDSLNRLHSNMEDTASSLRQLKRDIVGDPPTVRDEPTEPKEMVTPDNFMGRLQATISVLEEAHEILNREVNDFKNKALA